MINWHVSRDDHNRIMDVVNRATAVASEYGINYPMTEILMDLTAVHANGCPLKLADLAASPKFDFVHDVFGIRRHINRTTGQLEDCFVPRFAA